MRQQKKVSVSKRTDSVPTQVLAVAKKLSTPVLKPVAQVKSAKSKVISALKRLHPMD